MSWREACGALLLALSVPACNRAAAAGVEAQKPPPGEVWVKPSQTADIIVEPTREKPIEQSIRTSGKITFDEQRVSHVFSPITGRFVRIDA
jgi:multidrug efflux pump subunit AcrA (membrane-fusion protein)